MPQLTKGANVAVPSGAMTVTVHASADIDVAALLLAADGKVRSDGDFVFFNQPMGDGVQHVARSTQTPDAISIDTDVVPADVQRIVVTASLDGPGSFGDVGEIAARVDGPGGPITSFTPDGLGPETALVLVEVYRRGGDWKVRAVGQGYADGLAGIATDFGVDVEPAQAADPDTAPTPPVPTSAPLAPAAVTPPSEKPSTAPPPPWSAGRYGLPVGIPIGAAPDEGPAILVGVLP
jgi:stress response protein SCP2